MKCFCERCHKDISIDVDRALEKFEVGSIKCDKCSYIQNRYITETDLQLNVAISEAIYLVLTAMCLFVYDNMGDNWWLLLLIFPILACGYFGVKQASRWVYLKAPGKKKTANKKIPEDQDKIKKTMSGQFSIFFILAFASFLIENYRSELLGGMAIITVASFAKFYICTTNEKN